MESRNISPGAGLTIDTNLSNYKSFSDLIDPTDVVRSRTTTTDHRKTDHDRTSYFYTFPSIVSPTGSRLKPLLLVERVYGSSYPVPPPRAKNADVDAKKIDAGDGDGSDKRESITCQSLPTPPETPPVAIALPISNLDDSTLIPDCTTTIHTSTINASPFSSFSSISSISTSASFSSASSSASTPTFSSSASTSSASTSRSTSTSTSTSASTSSLPRYVRTPISPPPARSLSLSLPLSPDSTTTFDGSSRACNTLQFHLPFRPIRRVTGPEHTITPGDINTTNATNDNANVNANAASGSGSASGTHSRSISAEEPIQSTSAIPLVGLGPRHRPSFSLSHWSSGFRPRPSLIAALESIGSKFVSYTHSASPTLPTSPTTTTSPSASAPVSLPALTPAPVEAPVGSPAPISLPAPVKALAVPVESPVEAPAPIVVNTTLFDADSETASLSSHEALPAAPTAPTAPITSSVSAASIAPVASTVATAPIVPTAATVVAPTSSRPVLSRLQVPVNTRIRSSASPSLSPIATPTPTSAQTSSSSPSPSPSTSASASSAPSPLFMATPTRPLALARPRARSPLLLAPVIEAARLSGTSRDFVRPDVPTSPLSPISPDSPISPLTLTRGRGRLYVTNPDPPSICIEVTPAEEEEDAATIVGSGIHVDNEFEIKVDPSPFNSTNPTNIANIANSTDAAASKASFKADFYANPNRHIDVDHLSVSRILERHGSSASLFSITAVTVTDGEGAQDVEGLEDAVEGGDNDDDAYGGIDEVEMANPTDLVPLVSPIRRPSASSTGSSTVQGEDEYEDAKKDDEEDEDEEDVEEEEEEDLFGWEIMTPRKRRPSTLRRRFSGILRCF